MHKTVYYYFNVFRSFLRSSFMVFVEYRANFLINTLFNIVWTIVQITFISFLFYSTSSIKGWSMYEVMLLFGIDELIFPLFTSLALSSLNRVEEYVLQGTMDYILIKPINAQFYVSLRHINFFQISPMIFGISIVIYCVEKLHISISITKLFLLILLIFIGVWILYSVYLICVTFTFKFVKASFLRNIVLSFVGCMVYPLDIYSGIFRIIITVVIPVGIIVDFPTRMLVKGLSYNNLLYALLIASLFSLISSIAWKRGIRNYRSASS